VSAGARVVLFDLDGTLIDSIELIFQSYEHALRAHGLPPLAREHLLQGLGTPLAAQFGALTSDPREVEALVATYRTYNLARHDEFVRPYPGALEAVQALRARGARLGIVTSKRSDSARRGLALCGFAADLFETVVCLDDVARHKPHPEPVLTALARLSERAEASVYVGDSPHDAAAGRAAGARVAAAGWGPFRREHFGAHAPDWWLERPADLALLLAPPLSAGAGSPGA
jgi:pyrophosphatase PpaX